MFPRFERDDELGFVINDQDLEDNQLKSIIQRLAEDEEVCRLISDERMRCEQHKNNYTKLKIEFAKNFHEKRLLQTDLITLQSQHNDLKDTSSKALSQMETEVSELKCQLEYLHTQLPTRAQELSFRNNILVQTEATWSKKLGALLKEVDELKSSEASLLSENQCLKSDLSRLAGLAKQERSDFESLYEKKYRRKGWC